MSRFKEALLDKEFLILVHRGFSGGNILENTFASSIVAKLSGAEIIEIDIERSKDGEYYLFHSDNEWRLLREDRSLGEMTSSEIDEIQVYNGIGNKSGYYLERLEDYLEWLPADILVNIDRSWDYWSDKKFLDILQSSGKLDQLFVKSGYKPEVLSVLNEANLELDYVLICKDPVEVEKVKEYENINFLGVEVIAETKSEPTSSKEWIKKLKDEGLLIVVNAIDLGNSKDLFLGLDDTKAILSETGYDDVFDELLSYEPDIIQTDWPNLLSDYRLRRSK